METILINIFALGSGAIATAVVIWWCIQEYKTNNY